MEMRRLTETTTPCGREVAPSQDTPTLAHTSRKTKRQLVAVMVTLVAMTCTRLGTLYRQDTRLAPVHLNGLSRRRSSRSRSLRACRLMHRGQGGWTCPSIETEHSAES